MSRLNMLGLLVAIHLCLTTGDVMAKRAVGGVERHLGYTVAAMALWICGCSFWLPLMRAKGFARLVAMADATGLVIITCVGALLFEERFSLRQYAGLGFALGAIGLLL